MLTCEIWIESIKIKSVHFTRVSRTITIHKPNKTVGFFQTQSDLEQTVSQCNMADSSFVQICSNSHLNDTKRNNYWPN